HQPRGPRYSDIWRCVLMGGCMAGYQAAYFTAVTLSGITVTALIAICSAPLMIAALAPRVLGERLTPRVRVALSLGVVGTALLVARPRAGAPNRLTTLPLHRPRVPQPNEVSVRILQLGSVAPVQLARGVRERDGALRELAERRLHVGHLKVQGTPVRPNRRRCLLEEDREIIAVLHRDGLPSGNLELDLQA